MEFIRQINKSFIQSLKDLVPFIKGDWPLILSITIFVELMLQYFMYMQQFAAQAQTLMIAVIIGKVSASLTQYLFLTMLVPLRIGERDQNLPRGSFWAFVSRHVMPFTIESIRALAHVIMWTLLLIIPGVYKYIRLFFVPYVVLCDEKYHKGERDALERSNELTKGTFFPFLGLFILMFALEILAGTVREQVLQNPLIYYGIPGLVGCVVAVLLVNILLFRLYQLRVKASGH